MIKCDCSCHAVEVVPVFRSVGLNLWIAYEMKLMGRLCLIWKLLRGKVYIDELEFSPQAAKSLSAELLSAANSIQKEIEPSNKDHAQLFVEFLKDRKTEHLDELDEINVELRVLKSQWEVIPKKRRRHE